MTPFTIDFGERGDPPLLCLHGIGSCADAFLPQAPLANLCRRHLVAWDAPGYRNSADPDQRFTLDDWADAAAELIEANGGSADVLGVSWGGVTATRLALRHPERVRSLVLADSSVGSGGNPEGAAAMRGRGAELAEAGIEAFARSRAPRLLSAQAPEALVARAAEMMIASVRLPTYEWACHSMADADHLTELGRLSMPTLIVVGADDVVTPPDRSHVLAANIPGARLVTIPDAGHLANQEQPEAFNAAVADFLNAP